jgi:hypothetical protein
LRIEPLLVSCAAHDSLLYLRKFKKETNNNNNNKKKNIKREM